MTCTRSTARPLIGAAVIALTGMPVLAACEELPRTYSTAHAAGEQIFADDFERDRLGPEWRASGPGARIEGGHLVVEGAKNHPLWLVRPLPGDLRIDFDVWTDEEEGDIKFELAGDGRSHATTVNYVASGYVFVFGGWNNRLSAIARLDEHGGDRVTASEPRVVPGRRYHMSVVRRGSELVWEVDGVELLRLEDDAPLEGPEHAHFAFSGWESRVHFDNLVISTLAAATATATATSTTPEAAR